MKRLIKNATVSRFVKKAALSAVAATAALSGPAAAFSMSAPLAVYAQEKAMAATSNTPNGVASLGNGTASITINGNVGQTLIGKQFNVYQLFTAQNSKDGESISYTINQTYLPALQQVVGAALGKTPASVTPYEIEDYMQSLNTHKVEGANATQQLEGRYSDFRYFIEDVRDEIVKQGIAGSKVTVTQTKADNSITIGGLEYGYYVVDEVNVNNNSGHSAASLCMVNTANPAATVNIKSDYPSIEKQIKEDDNNVGWNDVADFEIGQTVPYRYLSTVPNMNGYDKYYFGIWDSMDDCLTFNKDSVVITIKGMEFPNSGNSTMKTYTLKSNEFSIVEKPTADATFRIDISDLKAIVDREFQGGMNNDNENVYGQAIEVTYNATLNDKAALHTGRPGFENDVWLEYSNNPDADGTGETGTTPKDTVVCFTYKLDVDKVNNYNKQLEGAKFRLYSDEACTQEVYVKANTSGGYNVINRDSLGGDDHTGGTQPGAAVEMVSNDEGNFVIFGLDQGTYWLKETSAPDGYRPLLDPIKLTLTPTFTNDRNSYVKGQGATDATLKALDASAEITTFYGGLSKTENQNLTTDVAAGQANLTVVNEVGSKLPITGSNMTLILLGAGAVIATVGVAINRKNKKSEKAE
ncbi:MULTISPECIES: isopeptide-forming domain-containing fimbrial protein [Erysipelotrichaceae]|uniref:isopeptide-forming domain-containing fimbrial protein n=1 Tax=Erysipelotrichaceae TaxID=128827 RepID=UPI00259B1C40|nr:MULTISPECIES: isopeptide-forming domain-containing fimbrial protein [Erysipelotrichaceae]